MSIRRTIASRRAVAAVSAAAALVLALSGCGGDDGGKSTEEGAPQASASATPSSEDKGEQQPDTAAGESVDPNAKLAEVQARPGVVLTINQVLRDAGGFVTVQGVIKNGSDAAVNPSSWVGNEPGVLNVNFNSVAGATLVDKVGKKRYYVLRDTDNRCLCTTKIRSLQPGDSTSIFMQFPAPPPTTTEVDFTLPTFATTSLKISG
ncbi:hypothetical protein OHT52_09350 [Streptomyces sp. NBC_00247]|uniref:hypothetical protein n=1 Tax=Streptomyces sp. NBC_00247 TaxID=2975689 RepID=UPI002E2C9D52|nr:hypothetical protein [Streptomyces sp. NBC_00247]